MITESQMIENIQLLSKTHNRHINDLNIAYISIPASNKCFMMDLSRNLVVHTVTPASGKTIKSCTLEPGLTILVEYDDETMDFMKLLTTDCHYMCLGCNAPFSASTCLFCQAPFLFNKFGCTTACADMYGGKNSLNHCMFCSPKLFGKCRNCENDFGSECSWCHPEASYVNPDSCVCKADQQYVEADSTTIPGAKTCKLDTPVDPPDPNPGPSPSPTKLEIFYGISQKLESRLDSETSASFAVSLKTGQDVEIEKSFIEQKMGDLKFFIISPVDRITTYSTAIGEQFGFQIDLSLADDKGNEKITLAFELDPAKKSTQDYELRGDRLEIEIQTRPKTDKEKSQSYARIGSNLGSVEAVMEPVIQSAQVVLSFLKIDGSKELMNYFLTLKQYARLRVININSGTQLQEYFDESAKKHDPASKRSTAWIQEHSEQSYANVNFNKVSMDVFE